MAQRGIFEELYLQMAAEPTVDRAWLSPVVPAAPRTREVAATAREGGGGGDVRVRATASEGATADDSTQAGEHHSYSVVVQMTQRDFVRDANLTLLSEFEMADAGEQVTFARRSAFPQALPGDAKGVVVSPSGQWRCVLRSREDTGKKKSEFEFWDHVSLVAVLDVTDLHGTVMLSNDQLGHLVWSPCEKFVAYSAERTLTKEEKVRRKRDRERDDRQTH
jgi:hypothetical protein